MPFSLSLLIYQKIQEKIQKDFEEKHIILNSKDIRNIANSRDKNRVIEVFSSAVVDHSPVDGFPYYLSPPVATMFYHDNFKRCLIASEIGKLAGCLSDDIAKKAVIILETLTQSLNTGYVQCFAWEALGKWLSVKPELSGLQKDRVQQALGGPTGSLLGALLFLQQAHIQGRTQDVNHLLSKGGDRVRYKVQKALFGYFLTNHFFDLDALDIIDQKDHVMREFQVDCRKKAFISKSNFERGAREIGLISGAQKSGFIPGTQQDDIGQELMRFAGEYISLVGYYLQRCWE